jgi:hypothetical protein
MQAERKRPHSPTGVPLPATPSIANDPTSPNRDRRRKLYQAPGSPTPQSVSSMEPATQHTWEEDKRVAQAQIEQYECSGRDEEGGLTKVLLVALDWLPEGGREPMATEIKTTMDDQSRSRSWKDDCLDRDHHRCRLAEIQSDGSTSLYHLLHIAFSEVT